MNKIRILLIGMLILTICFTGTVCAEELGLQFKEIIWDAGWIWILMLVMGIATIFDIIRVILKTVKPELTEQKGKPAYEVIVRKRIE